MEQYKAPLPSTRTLSCAFAGFLASLLCTAYVAAADIVISASGIQSALKSAIEITADPTGQIIYLGDTGRIVITYQNHVGAINYTGKENLEIRGWNWENLNTNDNVFTTLMRDVSGNFATLITAQKASQTYDILSGYRQSFEGTTWKLTEAETYWNTLSQIKGDATLRDLSGLTNPSTDLRLGDDNKWFSTESGANPGSGPHPYSTASTGKHFSVSHIHFDDVTVRYYPHVANSRYVNGLIGTNHNARESVSMGDITGNAFTNIDIALWSNVDTDYLAGGGIIGIRATGEFPVAGQSVIRADATMGLVSGNIFDGISIMATNATGDDFTLRPVTGFTSSYLEGGGLVGVNAATSPDMTTPTPRTVYGHAIMDGLTRNYFTDIHIMSNDVFLGGGLVGLNNNSKTWDHTVFASLPLAEGNVFGNGDGVRSGANSTFDINVEIAFSLRGGGVLGLNGLSAARMELGKLKNNAFAGISVQTGSYLRGGGIVGLQTNDGEHKEVFYGRSGTGTAPDPFVYFPVVPSSYIGDIYVWDHVGDTWKDIGPYVGGSAAFNPLKYDTPDSATATLQRAEGNLFLNQRIVVGSYLHGGGVVGVRGNYGEASLGILVVTDPENPTAADGLVGNVFKGIDVVVGSNSHMPDTVTGDNPVGKFLYGGGIVGVSGYDTATLAMAQGNYFEDLTVTVQSIQGSGDTGKAELYGGGFIGVDAYVKDGHADSAATIGIIEGNTFIGTNDENKPNVHANRLFGGGIIGVSNDSMTAQILTVKNKNTFTNMVVKTDAELVGGGVIGAWSDENTGAANSLAKASIKEVDENTFTGMRISAGAYLEGGGIIGVRSNNDASIDKIRNNSFFNNSIEVGTYLDGGGIIGATGCEKGATWIGLIESSTFSRNTVSTGNDVAATCKNLFGGLVYSYGLDDAMEIRNSLFLDNTFTAKNGGTVFGVVTVDTGANTSNTDGHVLNVTATNGGKTVFNANKVIGGIGEYNSLYFGVIPDPITNAIDFADANAKLIVAPDTGGIVALYDPIWVNQKNDSANYTFNMEVNGAGHFIWGGNNDMQTDGDAGTITFAAGSTTTILDGRTRGPNGTQFQLEHEGVQLGEYVPAAERYTMTLDAKHFTVDLKQGALLIIEGHNYWNLSDNDSNGDPVAQLNGRMHFNLNNTTVYKRGDIPDDRLVDHTSNTDYNRALLTIEVPEHGLSMVDLTNSKVSLSPVSVEVGRELGDGDRFYLIEVINGWNGFQGNSSLNDPNETFTSAESGTANFTDEVKVLSGVTKSYNFIIDKNLDNDPNNPRGTGLGGHNGAYNVNGEWDIATRYFVARLESGGGPGVFAPVPSVVTFLHNDPPRFSLFDTLYGDSCNPCDAARNPSNWVRTPFVETQGVWYRDDTGNDSYADVQGAKFQGGLVAQRHACDGKVIFGAFVDAGDGNYNSFNPIGGLDELLPTSYRARNDIEYLGGGVLLQRAWNSGFRWDTVFRGGNVKEEFYSSDLAGFTAEGEPVFYKMNRAYWGTDMGLNCRMQLNRRSTFDISGRYSWMMVNGKRVVLSTTEDVHFDSIHSHRLTVGGRWTVEHNPALSWYVGTAYRHELDGRARARVEDSDGSDIVLTGGTLRGGTGSGEVGLLIRPYDRFQLTTGLEGYVGRREGCSVFAAAAWRW